MKFLLHVIEKKDQFNIKEDAKNNLLESIKKYTQQLSPNPQTEQSQVLQSNLKFCNCEIKAMKFNNFTQYINLFSQISYR